MKKFGRSASPWLFAVVALPALCLSISSEDLLLRSKAGDLQVTAPRLHFLNAPALSRLRNGATVPFDFQLTISTARTNTVLARTFEHFVISYDLWEEKFQVVRLSNERKSSPRLSATGAEAWCVASLTIPSAGLPPQEELSARLEVRGPDPASAPPLFSEPAVSLSSLVDLFSRPVRARQEHWLVESGPFRLRDLAR